MAHTCPECGQTCYCNGDWDDIILDYDVDIENCLHCLDDECDDTEYCACGNELDLPEMDVCSECK